MPTPSQDDFIEITRFINARNADEWQTAGGLSHYQNHKFTIRPHAPRGVEPHTQAAGTDSLQRWIDSHSAQRFAQLTATIASLAENVATKGRVAVQSERPTSEFDAQEAFRSLTKIARLWEDHPDFKPAWIID